MSTQSATSLTHHDGDCNLPGDDMFSDPRWHPVEIAKGLTMWVWEPVPVTPSAASRWMRRATLVGSLLVSLTITFLPLVVL